MIIMLKEKIKLDKSLSKIMIVLIAYLVIMLIIFLPSYLRLRKEKLYIVTNNYKIKYEYGKWKKMDDNSNKEEYSFYEKGKFIGKYNAILLNKIFLYNDLNKEIDYDGYILGYRGSLKFSFYEIENNAEINENDKHYIDLVLEELKLNRNSSLSFFQKKEIDINNDGIQEILYSINNYSMEENSKEKFSIIFMVVNDKISIIAKEITNDENLYASKLFSIESIFDIKNDKKLELLYSINNPMGSIDNQCMVLYNLSSKKVIHNFCE